MKNQGETVTFPGPDVSLEIRSKIFGLVYQHLQVLDCIDALRTVLDLAGSLVQ